MTTHDQRSAAMPSYRVNYLGRSSNAPGSGAPNDLPNFMTNRQSGLTETEFEDDPVGEMPIAKVIKMRSAGDQPPYLLELMIGA